MNKKDHYFLSFQKQVFLKTSILKKYSSFIELIATLVCYLYLYVEYASMVGLFWVAYSSTPSSGLSDPGVWWSYYPLSLLWQVKDAFVIS